MIDYSLSFEELVTGNWEWNNYPLPITHYQLPFKMQWKICYRKIFDLEKSQKLDPYL